MYPIGLLAQAQDLQPRRGILFLGHILIDRDQDLRATVGHPHQCGGAIEPAVLRGRSLALTASGRPAMLGAGVTRTPGSPVAGSGSGLPGVGKTQ